MLYHGEIRWTGSPCGDGAVVDGVQSCVRSRCSCPPQARLEMEATCTGGDYLFQQSKYCKSEMHERGICFGSAKSSIWRERVFLEELQAHSAHAWPIPLQTARPRGTPRALAGAHNASLPATGRSRGRKRPKGWSRHRTSFSRGQRQPQVRNGHN